jgi:high-affinity iron transporter
VHWGIIGAVGLSIGASLLFQRAANQALWEGILAIAAAILVMSLIVHMWRVGKQLKSEIEGKLYEKSLRPGKKAMLGIFGFTLLMITREGMETALLLNALFFQMQSYSLFSGALAGLVCAGGVAWLWSRYGHRVNLVRFFQVTSIFLTVFVIQLLIYGFHELTEANIFPYSEPLHWATEPYGPDGRYGQYLTYMLIVLPISWLGYVIMRDRSITDT